MPDFNAQEVADALRNLRSGLHLMMDNLIREKNYAEAEKIAREMDVVLGRLIVTAQLSQRRSHEPQSGNQSDGIGH